MTDSKDLQSLRTEASAILKKARTIVFKVGSAVITDSLGLKKDLMRQLAKGMSTIWKMSAGRTLVLVTSGAVAAGRTVLRKLGTEPDTGLSARQAIAAIGQGLLMQAWDQSFNQEGFATAQVLLTRDDTRARQRYLNVRNTFAELFSWKVLPIVNENDTVSVSELKFGDNDSLSSLLANLVNADLVVNLTSAPGVRAEDPQKNPSAPVLPFITNISSIDITKMCGSKTNLGTGGMFSKLRAARRTAQLGVPTLILPGREEGIIERVFCGNELAGTLVFPASKVVTRRKYWLAYQTDPAGTLFLDEGAAKALLHEGRSLLPGGIVRVEGCFQKGSLVALRAEQGEEKEIGVGLSNYSSQEILRIMGLKRHEVAAVLGNAHYPDVIHRDNMLINAVL
ncbi:MAG: glutamate 5-kinase [Desulfovibrio sp.]|nr:glutamate 5-kinase [Desulfovibrio sp.]